MRKSLSFDALESRRLCDGTGYPDLPGDVFAPPPPTPYPSPPADGRDISGPLDGLPIAPLVTFPPGVVYPTVPGIPNPSLPPGAEPLQ